MAEEKDRADADVPADVTVGDSDLIEMGLDDVDEADLTDSEKVAKAAAGARPSRKKAEPAAGKGHATRKRSSGGGGEKKRTNPVQFVREVVAELKKVVWPTGAQLQQYFVAVLVFVLVMIGIVSALDLGFGTALLKLLG